MKINWKLMKEDIQKNVPILVIIVVYIIASNLLRGKVCPLRMILGIPCPGCGITRAFLLLSQGKIYEATAMHPFWIPLVVIVAAFLMVRYCVDNQKISKKVIYVLKICAMIVMLLCIVYYVYRMVVWFPDREPMVYDANNVFQRIMKILGFH
ncbi:MAG: DUF2752 domain-containing protein [Eubacterium sp.]